MKRNSFDPERFQKTQDARTQEHRKQGGELFLVKTKEGWGPFLRRFREVFVENLADYGTDPDVPYLEYLIQQSEAVEKGEKIPSDAIAEGALIRLAQDAGCTHEEVDKLKGEFFTNPRKRLIDQKKDETK